MSAVRYLNSSRSTRTHSVQARVGRRFPRLAKLFGSLALIQRAQGGPKDRIFPGLATGLHSTLGPLFSFADVFSGGGGTTIQILDAIDCARNTVYIKSIWPRVIRALNESLERVPSWTGSEHSLRARFRWPSSRG